MINQGRFIAFEGPEGCGKSTHLPLLADFLRSKGLEVVTTREPGGTQLAELIRDILQSTRHDAPVPSAEVLLFLASRAQHMAKIIRPALDRGAWVLTDRFEDSTFAYQGAGRGFTVDQLRQLNRFATGGISPDLVLVLDIDRSCGRSRLADRQSATATQSDRFESESELFHERLRQCFLSLAAAEPDRYTVIDSTPPAEEVQTAIRREVAQRLLKDSPA